MLLGAGQHVLAALGFDGRARIGPRMLGGALAVEVETGAGAGLAGAGAPVAELNRHHAVGLSRHDPGGGDDFAPAKAEAHQRRDDFAALAAAPAGAAAVL